MAELQHDTNLIASARPKLSNGGMRVSLLAAFCLFLIPEGLKAGEQGDTVYWNNDLDLIVKGQTFKLPHIDYLLSLLDIRPGMTVLDIGAGSGQQSYKLAEKLNGTGQVYATEIDPHLVSYIKAQARRRNLSNLQAVQVKKDGVDPFYGRHTYDLILLYDVVYYIRDRIAYYGQLKKFLKPRGRVVVVDRETMPDVLFYREDFDDWAGLIARLKQEPLDAPSGRNLRRLVETLMAKYPGLKDRRMESIVLRALNNLLNGTFFAQFTEGLDFKKDVSFTPEERAAALWMLHRLRLEGLPKEREPHEMTAQQFMMLQLLNKLVLIQHFRPYLAHGGLAPYVSRSPGTLFFVENDAHMREFEAAGFELEKKEPLIPFSRAWIFRSKP